MTLKNNWVNGDQYTPAAANAVANEVATKAPLDSPTFTGTVAGITKTMVGLGNNDNTPDSAKPVSTAQQAALDAKIDLIPALRAKQPIVCFTFDDAYLTDTTVVKPILDAQGIKAGFPMPTSYPGLDGTRMSWAQVQTLYADGHEIIAHSVDHAHMTDATSALTEAQKRTQVDTRATFTSHGITVNGFAYTFGEHDAPLRRIVRDYFPYALGVLSGGASSSQSPLSTYAIKRVALDDTTLTADHTAQIDTAITNGELLVFIIHSGSGTFTSGGGGTARLNAVIDYAQAHSVPILTPSQAVALVHNTVDFGDYPNGSNYLVVDGKGNTYTGTGTRLADSTSAIGTLPSAYSVGVTYQNVIATASPVTPRPDNGPGLLVTTILNAGPAATVTNMNRQDFYGTNDFGHWSRTAGANNGSWGAWNSHLTINTASSASSATPTPFNTNGFDFQRNVTALAVGATLGAPSASAPMDGQEAAWSIKDNGTPQTLAFNAAYRFPANFPAPTITVANQVLFMVFRYNATDSKWDYTAGTVPPASAFGFPYTVDPGIIRSSDQKAAPSSNGVVYARVLGAGTVSKIGLQVVTSSGNISVGVYSNSGSGRSAVPLTRLATSGAVACPAAGYAEVSLGGSVAVNAGDWFALSVDNVTATFYSLLGTAADTDLGKGRQFRQSTAHPVPSTASGVVATVGYTFVLVGVP